VLTWIQGPPNNWKIFVGNRVDLIQEETAAVSWRYVPSQSNPADFISREIEPSTLPTSTLWWKGKQWLSQEISSWPTTEVNTHIDKLEIRNVNVALLKPPEYITERIRSNTRKVLNGSRGENL